MQHPSIDEDRANFFQITQLIKGDKVLTVSEDEDIVDIIDRLLEKNTNQNGFYIVDLTKIIDKYTQWTTLLPRVKPYYAVKCNPDKNILKILKILGAGFDCASINEMIEVRNIYDEDDSTMIRVTQYSTGHNPWGYNVSQMGPAWSDLTVPEQDQFDSGPYQPGTVVYIHYWRTG